MKRRIVLLPLVTLLVAILETTLLLGAAADPPSIPDRPGDLGTGWREPELLPGADPAQLEMLNVTDTGFTDWWKIVYQSFLEWNWEICLTSGKGDTVTRLTDNLASDIHPRLNRGCTRIAFASNRDGDYEIWTMNIDGSGLTQLTFNETDDVMPAWSYDGTHIAFQSYRNGQSEVYVMNDDGSNQVRLTNNAAYDGEPSYSADGSQIAFTSNRGGGYGIWSMDANGGNPVPRASQALSENPAWAPLGERIAYDADLDGDGFQELMSMSPDGTNHTQIYNPDGPDDPYVHAWARSWSPDGEFVAWSRVKWTRYKDQWYWVSGYLYAIHWKGWGLTQLSAIGVDWNPDWQSADIVPPISSMTALPATSPSPFPVSWSSTDASGSGVIGYDVQVRDGEDGAWTDWLLGTSLTSGSYPGQAGHRYYFRCRAGDNAGNVGNWPATYHTVTTVETLAPVTTVAPLPQFSPREFRVSWKGIDPGGSGIASYDIQYLKTPGEWLFWRSGHPETSSVMRALPGGTYYFRSRGMDRAGNVEDWPAGDGDTWTTVYSSRLTGTVRDNAGAPVGGASTTLTPDPLAAYPSDREGAFSAYTGLTFGTYNVTWAKAGYGALPAATFGTLNDAIFEAVLPPADNVVADWGFESGDLLPSWLSGGTYPPAVMAEARHTGGYGAALGLPLTWQPALTLVTGRIDSPLGEAFAVDAGGTAHVVWNDWDSGRVLYRRRQSDGIWSAVEMVSTLPGNPGKARLAVDASGIPHVVWEDRSYPVAGIYYSSRNTGGIWSTPLNLTTSPYVLMAPDLAITPDGAVHVVWLTFDPSHLVHTRRDPDGSWSALRSITENTEVDQWRLAAGGDGTLHVVFRSTSAVFHTRRDVGGGWSGMVSLASAWSLDDLDLAVDGSGNAHIALLDYGNTLLYRRRSQVGDWSNPIDISRGTGPGYYIDLAVSQQGTAHALWEGSSGRIYHAWQQGTDPWTGPVAMLGEEVCSGGLSLALDPEGIPYAAWLCTAVGGNILRATRWESGDWGEPMDVWQDPSGIQICGGFGLAADAQGGAHVVWESCDDSRNMLYARTKPVEQTGDSLLFQVVTVPADVPSRLSFLHRLGGASAVRDTSFQVLLDDGSGPVDLLTTYVNTGGWKPASFDLAPWAGKTVKLTFGVTEVAHSAPLQLVLDEVTVGRTYPDLWVDQIAQPSAAAGGRAVFTLTYGNRGGAAAAAAVLTDTLPAGLTFESADPPPSTVEPSLTWHVGDLDAHTGPFTVILHARTSSDLAPGTTLMNALEIGGTTAELEMLDNRSQAELWIGHRIFLPLVSRAY